MQSHTRVPLRKWLAFGALSFGSCLGAYFLASVLASSLKAPPPHTYDVAGVAISASSLDLGEIEESASYVQMLPLRNISGKVVQFSDIQAGCACVDVSPRQITLRPGEKADLRLTLDLTKRAPWERHAARRSLAIPIRPFVERGAQPRDAWVLVGVIRSRVTAGVDALGFGDRLVAGAANESREIEARVHEPDTVLTANVIPPEAGSVSLTARPEGRYIVAITPSPSLPVGSFKFTVTLCLAGRDGGGAKPVLPITVHGVMQPEVRAFPSQMFLGPRQIGTTADTTVHLQSPPGAGWEVDRVEVDSPDVKVSPDAEGYRVVQAIKQEGDASAVVRFFVRRGRQGPVLPVEM